MTTPAPEKAAPIPADVLATEAMVEAAAKAIHDHWQNGPGPHARSWEKCCKDLPGAAADFRAKARAGLVAAIMQDRADRQEERIREDERDRIYERAERHAAGKMPDANAAAAWLTREEDVMLPADRARLRGVAS